MNACDCRCCGATCTPAVLWYVRQCFYSETMLSQNSLCCLPRLAPTRVLPMLESGKLVFFIFKTKIRGWMMRNRPEVVPK